HCSRARSVRFSQCFPDFSSAACASSMHLPRSALDIAPHRLSSALCAAEPGPTDGTSSPASAPLAAKIAANHIPDCVLDIACSFWLMSYGELTAIAAASD